MAGIPPIKMVMAGGWLMTLLYQPATVPPVDETKTMVNLVSLFTLDLREY